MGQTRAAQALAKLTITSDPEMTFPGERVRVGSARPGPAAPPPLAGPWGLSQGGRLC